MEENNGGECSQSAEALCENLKDTKATEIVTSTPKEQYSTKPQKRFQLSPCTSTTGFLQCIEKPLENLKDSKMPKEVAASSSQTYQTSGISETPELDAYLHLVDVFRTRGDLSLSTRRILRDVGNSLNISLKCQRTEIRKAKTTTTGNMGYLATSISKKIICLHSAAIREYTNKCLKACKGGDIIPSFIASTCPESGTEGDQSLLNLYTLINKCIWKELQLGYDYNRMTGTKKNRSRRRGGSNVREFCNARIRLKKGISKRHKVNCRNMNGTGNNASSKKNTVRKKIKHDVKKLRELSKKISLKLNKGKNNTGAARNTTKCETDSDKPRLHMKLRNKKQLTGDTGGDWEIITNTINTESSSAIDTDTQCSSKKAKLKDLQHGNYSNKKHKTAPSSNMGDKILPDNKNATSPTMSGSSQVNDPPAYNLRRKNRASLCRENVVILTSASEDSGFIAPPGVENISLNKEDDMESADNNNGDLSSMENVRNCT